MDGKSELSDEKGKREFGRWQQKIADRCRRQSQHVCVRIAGPVRPPSREVMARYLPQDKSTRRSK
jgi:hypothetical protein